MDSRQNRPDKKNGTLRSPKLDRSVSRMELDVKDQRHINPMPGRYAIGIQCSQLVHAVKEKAELNIDGVPTMVDQTKGAMKKLGLEIVEDEEDAKDDLCLMTTLALSRRCAKFCDSPGLSQLFRDKTIGINTPTCISALFEKVGPCIDSSGQKFEFSNFSRLSAQNMFLAWAAHNRMRLDYHKIQPLAKHFSYFEVDGKYYLAPHSYGDPDIFKSLCDVIDKATSKAKVKVTISAAKYYNECKDNKTSPTFIGYLNQMGAADIKDLAVGLIGPKILNKIPEIAEIEDLLQYHFSSCNPLFSRLLVYNLEDILVSVYLRNQRSKTIRAMCQALGCLEKDTPSGSRVCSVAVQSRVGNSISLSSTAWIDTQDIYVANVLQISSTLHGTCWFDFKIENIFSSFSWCFLGITKQKLIDTNIIKYLGSVLDRSEEYVFKRKSGGKKVTFSPSPKSQEDMADDGQDIKF